MKNLTVDEKDLLETYQQLNNENKLELIERMKALLDEQGKGNVHAQKQQRNK